jgi:hypothetical protein
LLFVLVTALFTVIMLRHGTMVGDALEKYNLKELMLDLFLCRLDRSLLDLTVAVDEVSAKAKMSSEGQSAAKGAGTGKKETGGGLNRLPPTQGQADGDSIATTPASSASLPAGTPQTSSTTAATAPSLSTTTSAPLLPPTTAAPQPPSPPVTTILTTTTPQAPLALPTTTVHLQRDPRAN